MTESNVSIISGATIPLLLDSRFPKSVRNFELLSDACKPYRHTVNLSKAILFIREDKYKTQDESGWILIHWPSVTRQLLAQPKILSTLVKLGYGSHVLLPREESHPQEFEAQWAILRNAWRDLVPPGSLIWSESDTFQNLLNVFPAEAKSESQITVMRAGCLLSHKFDTLEQRLSHFSVFRQLYKIHDKVREKLPLLLNLIIDVLREARTSDINPNPYEEWGVAWCNQGLVIDGVRALMRAKEHHRLHDKYPGDLYDSYLSEWVDPSFLEEKPAIKGIPPMSKYIQYYDRYTTRALEPLGSTISNYTEKRQSMEYNGRHVFFLPLWKQENIRDVLLRLSAVSRVVEEGEEILTHGYDKETAKKLNQLLRNTASKGKVKTTNPFEATKNLNTKKIYTVSLDMRQLGFYDASQSLEEAGTAQPMSINITKYRSDWYVTYPSSLLEAIPILNDPRYFWRNPQKKEPKDKWGDEHLLVERVDLKSDQHSCCIFEGLVFLNPALLKPKEGEAITLLNSAIGALKTDSPTPVNITHLRAVSESFDNFCKWLFLPKEGLEEGEFGAELELPLTEESPITLTTYAERLQFLVDKAEHMAQKAVAFMAKPGRSGKRSYNTNSYDTFIQWYALKYEMHELPVVLNKKQMSEYLAQRWLWWRRPLAVYNSLSKFEYNKDFYKRTPTLNTSTYNMRSLLEYADRKFGKSFTSID